MSRKFDEAYKVNPKTILNWLIWNKVFSDVDARVADLETLRPEVEAAVSDLYKVGLDRINAVLLPAFEQVGKLVELGFMVAHSNTPLTLAPATQVQWVVPPGDERDLFRPSPFVIVSRGGDLSYYAVVQTIGYNRVHGEYTGTVVSVGGSGGPYSDWELAASAGATVAQMDMLTKAIVAKNASEAAAASVSGAAAHAATATTKAGEALASANAAASTFNNLQVFVEQALGSLLPATFADDGLYFTLMTNGLNNPANLTGTGITYPTVAGYGKVLQGAAVAVPVVPQGYLALAPGRIYRTTATVRVTVDETNSSELGSVAATGVAMYDGNGVYLGLLTPSAPILLASAGWQSITADITTATILAAQPSAAFIRPVTRLNYNIDVNPSNATMQCALLRSEDVTSVKAAALSAADAAAFAASLNSALLAPKANPVFSGLTDVGGRFAWSGDITPAALTADTNNYAPTGMDDATVIRLSGTAARVVTGLAGGTDGRLVILYNVGTFPLTLAEQNASSTSTNRFSFGSSRVLGAGKLLQLRYDGIEERWKELSAAVNKASAADIWVHTDDEKMITALALANSEAWVTQASAASLVLDWNAGQNRRITVTHTMTLGAPLNPVDGRTYAIKFIFTGSVGTPTLPATFKFGYDDTIQWWTSSSREVVIWAQWDATSNRYDCTLSRRAL